MPDKIIVRTPDGTTVSMPENASLNMARQLFLNGYFRDVPLCSGLGKCGLCRIRFVSSPPHPKDEETKRFSSQEIAEGWRLSCLHPAVSCEIKISHFSREIHDHQPVVSGPDIDLSIDLGTTSLHWVAENEGQVMASGQGLNPQLGLGGEIMSRLAFAATENGTEILRDLVLDRIREIATRLPGPIKKMAVSGNPAMTCLLLGLDTSGLASAPYEIPWNGGEELELAPDLPPAYMPTMLAPFVGADLTAGLGAIELGEDPPPRPFVLADLGTNGEFIMGLESGEYLCASVPMGPALEGVGLAFGRTATPGTVVSFTLTPTGPRPEYFEGPPSMDQIPAMTGTGYLSLTALLLRNSILDQSGQFSAGKTPLARILERNLTTWHGEPAFRVEENLYLPASDVEEILKVKAAFNTALATLLSESGITPSQLERLCLAGAMGEYVNLDDLETLGFLPPGLKNRTLKAGNTSLSGTRLLLNDPQARKWVETLPGKTTPIDLTEAPSFTKNFLNRMRFYYAP